MAMAQCALSSHFTPSPHNPTLTLKPKCSISSPASSKPTKRKNHLRPKLLKPLTKPLPTTPLDPLPEPPQQQQPIIHSAPQILDTPQEIPYNELGLQEAHLQAPEIPEAESGITTWSVTQLVLYVVGLFVVQTVVTVWLWSREKGEGGGESGLEVVGGEKKGGFWFGGGNQVEEESVVYVDEREVEAKIAEIRVMARKVRASEANKLSEESSVVGVGESESIAETMDVKADTDIQKEVDGKLSKLLKRLRADKPVGSVNSYLKISDEANGKKEEVLDVEVVDEDKLRFEGGPFELKVDPKEDQNDNVINGNGKVTAYLNKGNNSGIDISNGGSALEVEEKTPTPGDNSLGRTTSKLEGKDTSGKGFGSTQNIGRKSEKERKSLKKRERMKIEKAKSSSGVDRENDSELAESRNSSKPRSSSSTGSLEHKQVTDNSNDKQMSTVNDMWWSHLPYVLAILLRRTSEDEGPGGLYSLKMGDDDSQSHIIAFEDQRDASNFCYILDAFFAELGDLTADVVPLSVEELKDDVETSTMKVFVLRKGQLQLYAGQPLADVEMTIRSLVK